MAHLERQVLGDDELVTQFVFAGEAPRNVPRPRDQDGLSVLRGEVSTNAAASYVRRARRSQPGDGVRVARVGALRSAGFTVTYSPSRLIPLHVSTSRDNPWTDEVGSMFDACFGDVVDTRGGEEHG